jgi:hypothetical protein
MAEVLTERPSRRRASEALPFWYINKKRQIKRGGDLQKSLKSHPPVIRVFESRDDALRLRERSRLSDSFVA